MRLYMYSSLLHFCYLHKLTICFFYSDKTIHLFLFAEYEFICKVMGISGASGNVNKIALE